MDMLILTLPQRGTPISGRRLRAFGGTRDSDWSDMAAHPLESATPRRILITAGPTHEPIDAVRYLGNRSSGRLGIALADEAVERGHEVILLLGPTHRLPEDSRVRVLRFQTTAELEGLLREHFGWCEVLVMAAAVADYRIKGGSTVGRGEGKLRREGQGMTLTLEPTPDLLASCTERRQAGQCIVGFALEPRREMKASARRKLERKRVDMIVANPLETMDSATIEAQVYLRDGRVLDGGGPMEKAAFAGWLLDQIAACQGAADSRMSRVP